MYSAQGAGDMNEAMRPIRAPNNGDKNNRESEFADILKALSSSIEIEIRGEMMYAGLGLTGWALGDAQTHSVPSSRALRSSFL